VRADQRDYSIDEKTFKQLFKTQEQRSKVVLALNCVDKIEPINRKLPFQPSKEQLRNIEEKVNTLSSLFGLPTSRIIPYSAVEEWNLNGLMDTIAEVLKQSKNISIPPWITDEWKQLRSQLRFNY
jgi:predicted GTPase